MDWMEKVLSERRVVWFTQKTVTVTNKEQDSDTVARLTNGRKSRNENAFILLLN